MMGRPAPPILRDLPDELCRFIGPPGAWGGVSLGRPTAGDVSAFWSGFVELWPEWTDAEKLEMIGHVVRRVDVRQKNSVFLELSPIGGKRCLFVERKFSTNQEWEPLVKLSQ